MPTRKIALIASAVAAFMFIAGALVGRQFPAHRYERFGSTFYVLDVTTGIICDPRPLFERSGKSTGPRSPNFWDQALANAAENERKEPPYCGNSK
jgi:hypothetical protein